MAMSKVWAAMAVLALVFGIINGNIEEVSAAALEGAAAAVTLSISIAGTLCLWTGVMEAMKSCGFASALSRVMRPLLKILFPEASRRPDQLEAISANVSANLLGLGNAATPLGIKAVRLMRKSDVATDELCLFVVMNTASIQLIPATVAGVRSALGCSTPFDILPAVWMTSVLSLSAGIIISKLLARLVK
jgi:spore maturation protein A